MLPSVEIRSIGTATALTAEEPRWVFLDIFDAWTGGDVELEVWGRLAAGAELWVLVRGQGAPRWQPHGPARELGGGLWQVSGVRFGIERQQGRHFTVRAAILDEPPETGALAVEDLQRDALALSAPWRVTVERRVVEPYGEGWPAERHGLAITTLDHRTVAPGEPLLVPATVEVAGTLSPSWRGEPSPAGPFLYVVAHPAATDRWRIFGPAEVEGAAWRLREVTIADAGEVPWLRYQLFAILAREVLPEGEVAYERWRSSAGTASESIEVTIEPRPPIVERIYPKIEVTGLTTFDETIDIKRNDEQLVDQLALARLEDVLEVQGTLADLPQGASVWLLVNHTDTSIWEVHGSAIVTPPTWRQPLVHTARPRKAGPGRFRLVAMISTARPPRRLVDYATWRDLAITVSDSVLLVETQAPGDVLPPTTLEIQRIAGSQVQNPHTLLSIEESAAVAGRIQELPDGGSVWVGTREAGSDDWWFSGPALIDRGRWIVPGVRFAPGSAGSEVVAVAATGDLPSTPVPHGELSWYTQAASPPVVVADDPAVRTARQRRFLAMTLWLVAILLLLAFEYFFAVVSAVFEFLYTKLDELVEYLRRQFPSIPTPQPVPSTIGVIILGFGIYAIVSYFPIYTHVLETVLDLPPEKSASLALLLITFTGLAGVILHLSVEYTGSRAPEYQARATHETVVENLGEVPPPPPQGPLGIPREDEADLGPDPGEGDEPSYLAVIAVGMVTLFLWGVQALLYLKLYLNQVEPGDNIVPTAMAAAAFFIAFIETLGFYWATRLGLPLLASLAYHLIVGPPMLMSRMCEVLAVFFRSLPSRQRRPPPTAAE